MNSKKVWIDWQYFISFGFGSGLLPKAPGTFGTIAAIPLYFLLFGLPAHLYLLVCIFWDEIVGYLFTMYLVPFSVFNVFLGFIFFRVFDIWKPLPIGWFDRRLKGGLGIMLDDFIAAVFAWVALQIVIRII